MKRLLIVIVFFATANMVKAEDLKMKNALINAKASIDIQAILDRAKKSIDDAKQPVIINQVSQNQTQAPRFIQLQSC